MRIRNTSIVAIKAITTNKSRSFLTMLGVIIGVFSVVLLTAIGNGLQAYISDEFEAMGASNIIVMPGNIFGEGGGFDREAQINAFANNKLKIQDAKEIERLREYIDSVVFFSTYTDDVSFRGETKSATVIGTRYFYAEMLNTVIEKGDFFTKADELGGKKTIVLGWAIADELFGTIDPVGKRVKLGTQTFEVAGVAEKKGGGFGGPSLDTYAYIPYKTAFKIYDDQKIVEIVAKAKSKEIIPEAINAIEKVMLKRLDEEDFSVFDQKDILDTINQFLGVVTAGLGGIAAISLLVGGIGIMNIMLVSVTERTREIGLRKALGATPNLILWQFLIESALLSVVGGLIGLLLAYGVGQAIQPIFPAKITPDAVALAFGVSTVVGLVFGAAPARRASQLSPIEALRYE